MSDKIFEQPDNEASLNVNEQIEKAEAFFKRYLEQKRQRHGQQTPPASQPYPSTSFPIIDYDITNDK